MINDNLNVNSHENHSSYEIEDRFSYASQKLSCIPATSISDKGENSFAFGVGLNLNLSCFQLSNSCCESQPAVGDGGVGGRDVGVGWSDVGWLI